MAYQLQEINRRIREDTPGFLAECDALYHDNVCRAADRILDHLRVSPIVLLSGPSGSGKTTTAMKIEEELGRRGVRSHTVSMDNYFRTVLPDDGPRTPEGDYDYESPLCVDMELLDDHFTALSRGEEIRIPYFSFAQKRRSASRWTPMRLGKNEIAIFEGIHALNDSLTARHPEATKLYISARSDVMEGEELRFKGTWLRLTRRCVRDHNFRGASVADTLAMWANVRRGEKLYISPFKGKADIVFDSALPYEVPVLRHFALPLFQAIPAEVPRRQELLELIAAFDRFLPIDPALVAPDSLLREFIGGGAYVY